MKNKYISVIMAIVLCAFTISACGTTADQTTETGSSAEISVSNEEIDVNEKTEGITSDSSSTGKSE